MTILSRQERNFHPEKTCQRNFQHHNFKMIDIDIWIMVGLNGHKGLFQPIRFSDLTVTKCVLKPEGIQK